MHCFNPVNDWKQIIRRLKREAPLCKTRQSSLIFGFKDRRGPESVSNKPFVSFHWVQHANEGVSARF